MDLKANESLRRLQSALSRCIANDVLDLQAVVVSSFILASYQLRRNDESWASVLFYMPGDAGDGNFLLPLSLSSFALLLS